MQYKSQELCSSIQQLQETFINSNCPDEITSKAQTLIDQANQLLAEYPGSKPYPHFDVSQAFENANWVLPNSPISGPMNPIAPALNISFDKASKQVLGTVKLGNCYEGPKHSVHGATIAGIHDQVLALASVCANRPGPTAYLHIDYLKPAPLHQTLEFKAWVDRHEGKKTWVVGECYCDGELINRSEGLFILYQG